MNTPTKREVRHAARGRRRGLAAALDVALAGRVVADAVLALLHRPARVAVYESLPGEPPTGPLVEALVAAGHTVVVPVVLHDWDLEWRPARPGHVADASTVARLPEDAPRGEDWLGRDTLATCDLVLVPGLGVDRHGNRLGQGGGCYDRALRHRAPGSTVLVLLHDDEVGVADLPHEAHDVPVDGWVTTSGRVGMVGGVGGGGVGGGGVREWRPGAPG